jgi:hypothetical protein
MGGWPVSELAICLVFTWAVARQRKGFSRPIWSAPVSSPTSSGPASSRAVCSPHPTGGTTERPAAFFVRPDTVDQFNVWCNLLAEGYIDEETHGELTLDRVRRALKENERQISRASPPHHRGDDADGEENK